MKRATTRAVIVVLCLLAAIATGCSTRFPYGTSWDRHNFVSTKTQPLSLTLKDTVTGENIWQLDIPVGKMAVLDFEHDTDWVPGQTTGLPAEKLSWGLFDPGSIVNTLDHEMALPGHAVLLKVEIRKPGLDEVAQPPADAAPVVPVVPVEPAPAPAPQPAPGQAGTEPSAVPGTPAPAPTPAEPTPAPATEPNQPGIPPLPPLDIPEPGTAPAAPAAPSTPIGPKGPLGADDSAQP
jgi:hypothetical protein